MFESIFRDLEQALPGMLAVAVVGDDGMEVESYIRKEVPHEVMSAELNGVLRNLHRIQLEQALGRVEEVVIRTEGQNLLMFSLTGGLFVLLVTESSETTGKARYEVGRRAHQLIQILS
jgi:predicted regulator of Ras-like GTPase activity (Roadblock/LC7/MglB family)